MLGAGRGIGDDAEACRLRQCRKLALQRAADARGLFGKALGLERLAAALAVEMVGHDHVEAGAVEQRQHGVVARQQVVLGRRRAEHAGGAGGEIDHAIAGAGAIGTGKPVSRGFCARFAAWARRAVVQGRETRGTRSPVTVRAVSAMASVAPAPMMVRARSASADAAAHQRFDRAGMVGRQMRGDRRVAVAAGGGRARR